MNKTLTLTMNPALDLGSRIDHVAPDRKLRCDNLHIEPGGGGVNVARAMKRLKSEATAIFPSGGRLGSIYESLLEDENVSYESVEAERGICRVNTNIRETSKNRQYRFCTPGMELKKTDCERVLHYLEERLERGMMLVVSGSLPPGVSSDFYVRVARLTNEKEARCILDASDSMSDRLQDTPVSWITPNKREFEQITQHSIKAQDLEKELKHFVAHSRVRNVLLTMGSEGVLYVGEEGCHRTHSPEVEKVSAVGAGDSAVAGLASALARGESHETAIKWAVAAGAAAVMTSDTRLFKEEDFERLRKKLAE